jgi:Zn-dependent protease
MNAGTLIDGAFWFLAFLFSTTVHEAAHAYVAMRGGDRTAYRGGQVSLSPIPHIRREPIGMLVVPLLTAFTQGWAMGWASAPIDPRWAERHPRRAAWMSAAGPAGNFLLAVLSWGLLRGGLALGYFAMPERLSFSHLVVAVTNGPAGVTAFAAQGLSVMLMLNVLLGTFNLLPLPPLDGSTAVELLLPDQQARSFRGLVRTPMFSLVGLLVAWRVFPHVARPLFDLVLKALYPGASFVRTV